MLRFWQLDAERDSRYYDRYLAPALVRLALALDRGDVARQVAGTAEADASWARACRVC